MKNVLTIAGSDPSGGAGIQSDLATFSALGARGLSAITALTAQNSRAVRSVCPVPGKFLKDQLDMLLEEFTMDAAKTGMLGSVENLRVIRRFLKAGKIKNLVMDTPVRSSSGAPLLDKAGVRELSTLFPYAAVVTPNLPEASLITGADINDVDGMERAAKTIYGMGAKSVLVKGGHLDGAPVDVLFDGRGCTHVKGRRIAGPRGAFHGTGCVLSAALAASLANGKGLRTAVKEARGFLEKELRRRIRLGASRGPSR